MSNKDLQRVTKCVSYIGHVVPRRYHITQKVSIAGQRSLYISVHDDEYPTAICLRKNVDPLIKSPDEELPQDPQQEQSSTNGEDS